MGQQWTVIERTTGLQSENNQIFFVATGKVDYAGRWFSHEHVKSYRWMLAPFQQSIDSDAEVIHQFGVTGFGRVADMQHIKFGMPLLVAVSA
jgi:hypothetical protein